MNIKNLIKVSPVLVATSLFSISLHLAPTKVWAASSDDVKEVSYDELVTELARKRNAYKNPTTNPLDTIKIHAGLGLITSANKINTPNGSSTKSQNGFQLSLGIDLLSPEWAVEAALRNFGLATSGSESRTLREFDLKMMNRGPLSNSVGYRLGAGIGTRYLKVEDSSNNISINETTPTGLFFGGFDAFASKSMSLGLEAGFRTALTNTSSDKGSMDVMVRLDTYF